MKTKEKQLEAFKEAIRNKAVEYLEAHIADDEPEQHHFYNDIYEIACVAKTVLSQDDDKAVSPDED